MRMRVRTGTVVTAVSVAVSFLTVCVPVAGSASAATSDAAASTASWAYGAIHSGSGSGLGGTYTYTYSATVGYALVLNETEPSPGNYTLTADRTMGVLLSVEFCRPSCAHPVVTASVGYHVWESIHATLNLTSWGNVTVNGTPTRALALRSTAVTVTTGLVEGVKVVDNGSVLRAHNLTVALNASSQTSFTPALGLVPVQITGPMAWTSTSAFASTGTVSWSVVYASTLGGGFSRNGTLTVTPTGAVTLNGSYGGATIHLGGSVYDKLGLGVSGPFALREGFLLIPDNAGLLGVSAPSWLTDLVEVSGSANYSQESVDVASSPTVGTHLGFGGSYVLWTSASANPAVGAAAPARDSGLAAAAAVPAASTSNATYVQGEPQTVGQAEGYQRCLSTGVGCPPGSSPRGLLGILVAVGVVAVAAVLAAAVVVERRRLPPPNYPNASLYPPGSPSGAPASALRPRTPPTAPAEDDPLGNLW